MRRLWKAGARSTSSALHQRLTLAITSNSPVARRVSRRDKPELMLRVHEDGSMMSKSFVLAGALTVCATGAGIAQNAPWPPPAGMSAGEYLQRHGRQYNPYTGGDPRRDGLERFRSLPQPSGQNSASPSGPASGSPSSGVSGNVPGAGLTSEAASPGQFRQYNARTGNYEIPCPLKPGEPARRVQRFPSDAPDARGNRCQ